MTDSSIPGNQQNLIWHGDGLCPRCSSFSQVEWLKSTVSWKCECCNFQLNLAGSIKMCAVYRPEKNPHSVRETLSQIRRAYGLNPALPPSNVSKRRSFWHPVEFAKNLAAGLVVEAVWRRMRK